MKTTKDNIPAPTGWRILLKINEVEEKTQGGIILAEISKDTARVAAQIGQVVAMGEDCYADTGRFTTEWCKEGDWVMIGKYAGIRFHVDGEEYRICNDDEIIAKVNDPNVIKYY